MYVHICFGILFWSEVQNSIMWIFVIYVCMLHNCVSYNLFNYSIIMYNWMKNLLVSTVVSVISSVLSSTTQPSSSSFMKDGGSTGNVIVCMYSVLDIVWHKILTNQSQENLMNVIIFYTHTFYPSRHNRHFRWLFSIPMYKFSVQ